MIAKRKQVGRITHNVATAKVLVNALFSCHNALSSKRKTSADQMGTPALQALEACGIASQRPSVEYKLPNKAREIEYLSNPLKSALPVSAKCGEPSLRRGLSNKLFSASHDCGRLSSSFRIERRWQCKYLSIRTRHFHCSLKMTREPTTSICQANSRPVLPF